MNTATVVRKWLCKEDAWVSCLTVAPEYVLAGCVNQIFKFDLAKEDTHPPKVQFYSLVESNVVLQMCVCNDSIFVAASDNKVKEWLVSSFSTGFVRSFEAHKGEVREVCAGKELFFSGDTTGTIISWELKSDQDQLVMKPTPERVFRSVAILEVVLPLVQIASHTFKIWSYAFGPLFKMPIVFMPFKIVIPFINFTFEMDADIALVKSMFFCCLTFLYIFLFTGNFYQKLENHIQSKMIRGEKVKSRVFHAQTIVFFFCYVMATSMLNPAANSLFDSVACHQVVPTDGSPVYYESNIYEV